MLEINRREADEREKMTHSEKDLRMCASGDITLNVLCY